MTLPAAASPKVSIGIPTYNRCGYLRMAIDSALQQTHANIEVLVSDNHSSDDTHAYLATLSDPRVHWVREETNVGMIGNFNRCLAMATGDYFILLSDDDVLETTAMESLLRPFVNAGTGVDPATVGIVWCPCRIMDSAGQIVWTTEGGPAVESSVSLLISLFAGRRGPRLSSVLLRTADLRLVGGFDEHFGDLCDTGSWGQVALRYDSVVSVPAPLVRYRVHPNSGTGSARCEAWQQAGNRMMNVFLETLRLRGANTEALRLARVRNHLLANLTVDVLMRGKGRPGWFGAALAELWRSRSFMFRPYVAVRIVRDGWKLLRL